jgi:hypothetical protein
MLVFALIAAAFAAMSASAADLKGTVINGTTGKVAAADDVVLVSLSSDGMRETARIRTDRTGHFSLPVSDPQATHIVRVIHEGVTYHQVAQPYASVVAVEVYDVTAKLDNIRAVMDVQRFEATRDRLEVKQLVTMRNQSKPPRTVVKGHTFEIQLPPEAKVEYGLVQVEEEQPLKQKPIAGDQPGQYYFVFPMRPGDTRFAVVYRVPYEGKTTIQPTIRNRDERFVVMLPKSMKFEPMDAGVFQPMPGTTSDNVQGTEPLEPDKTASFRISGTGMLAELEGREQPATQGATTSSTRPGGGLAAPIGLPDPLEEYRWWILVSLAASMLLGGAVVVARGHRLARAADQPPLSRKVPARLIAKEFQRHTSVSKNPRRGRRSPVSRTSAHK